MQTKLNYVFLHNHISAKLHFCCCLPNYTAIFNWRRFESLVSLNPKLMGHLRSW